MNNGFLTSAKNFFCKVNLQGAVLMTDLFSKLEMSRTRSKQDRLEWQWGMNDVLIRQTLVLPRVGFR